MPIIKVIKPFGLRLSSDKERQDFGVGEHFLSDEELRHWFVQACIKEGRAALVPEPVAEDDGDPAAPGAVAEADASDAVEAAAEEAAAPGEDAAAANAEEEAAAPDAQAAPTREGLMALTVQQLREMATKLGVTVASNATKAVIVDALLAGKAGA